MESSKSPNKAIIGIIVIALIAVAATAVIVMGQNSNQSSSSSTVSEATTSPSTSTSAESSSTASASDTYKDGTYSATGRYQTPGGSESIGVTVTLANGITDASVTQNATGPWW